MNNTQNKSVSASSNKSKGSKSKASDQRKSRQDSYKKKFGNRPHMIIPQEDSRFIRNQTAAVQKLWHECWEADPYGSHWMTLNHTLKSSSFTRAKKILSDAGLFIFKADNSIRDSRQTVSWLVMNLHGARRNEFWLEPEKEAKNLAKKETKNLAEETKNLAKKETKNLAEETKNLAEETKNLAAKARKLASISSESYTQSQSQNPSETSQERLSNSSKELLETLPVDPWDDDRDRNTALEGRVTSASSKSEKGGQRDKYPEQKPQSKTDSSSCRESSVKDTSEAVVQPSLETYIEEAKKNHPHMSKEVIYAVAQKLAIQAEQTTEEYLSSSKEALARIKAITERLKEKKKRERFSRLRGD